MKTRKILSFKEEGGIFVCQMQYKEGTTGVAYLTKAEFFREKLKEKLETIDPSLVNDFDEVIDLTIEEVESW